LKLLSRLLMGIWKFWSRPLRAEPAAAFRISIGVIVLLDTAVSLLPRAADWFGPDGMYPAKSYEWYVNSFWRWSVIGPDWSTETLQIALGVLILFALLTTLGLFTRLATIGMWVLLVSFQMRNPYILNGGDILLRAASFCLMLMPAGAAWSLDNLARHKLLRPIEPSPARRIAALAFTHPALWAESWRGESSRGFIRPWTIRLAQIQLVIVYFFTGIDKVRGVNSGSVGDWLGGHAAYRALNHGTIGRFAIFGELPWWLFAPGAWITLAWEIAFPLLVLWKRTRWYALSIGYVLHVGIFLTMEVTHFSFTTMAFYWLFVPAVILMDAAGKATGSNERRKYLLFYDGMCHSEAPGLVGAFRIRRRALPRAGRARAAGSQLRRHAARDVRKTPRRQVVRRLRRLPGHGAGAAPVLAARAVHVAAGRKIHRLTHLQMGSKEPLQIRQVRRRILQPAFKIAGRKRSERRSRSQNRRPPPEVPQRAEARDRRSISGT
jgi:hypothetical protein